MEHADRRMRLLSERMTLLGSMQRAASLFAWMVLRALAIWQRYAHKTFSGMAFGALYRLP